MSVDRCERPTPQAGRALPRRLIVLVACLGMAAALLSGCDVIDRLRGQTPTTTPVGPTTASPQPEPARPLPLAGKVAPGPGAYLGVYVPPAPFDLAALDSFEAKAGKNVAIVMWYQPWAEKNRNEVDLGACAALLERGQVPLITWEPWDPGSNANKVRDPGVNPDYRLASIIAGDHDDYLRTWARDIKKLGGPVMLRPMHEMNGNWYPWCGTVNGNKPGEFKLAWRHIHDLFAEEGATNVTWVWSINHESVPATNANRYAAYYPGDEYVDWTSISGFNWGTSSPYSSWRSWTHWYTRPLAYLKTLDKPICISEFATVEKGGNKAAWIKDAYHRIAGRGQIRAVVYYSAKESGGSANQDWRVDTSAASLRAFKKAVSPTHFDPGPVTALADWQARLSGADRTLLGSFERLY